MEWGEVLRRRRGGEKGGHWRQEVAAGGPGLQDAGPAGGKREDEKKVKGKGNWERKRKEKKGGDECRGGQENRDNLGTAAKQRLGILLERG